MMKNKKGATSISVGIMVIITLALTGAALFVFITSKPAVGVISGTKFMDDIYIEEISNIFFIRQLADNALLNMAGWNNEEFAEKFEQEAGNYKGEGFIQITDRINNKDYIIEEKEGRISLIFNDFSVIKKKIIKENKIIWAWYIIPAGMAEEIQESSGAIYETNLVIEINKNI